MVLGTILSYYLSLKLMDKMNEDSFDYDNSTVTHIDFKIPLNKYEKCVSQDLIIAKNLDTNLKDVICPINVKDDIKFILDALKNKIPKNIKLLDIPNGILFHGPPGTGKTMLAKAIAKESNIHFLNMNISTVENKFYGESPKILKAYFTLAEKLKPCIIFIDEMDGLFSVRNALDQSNVNSLKTLFLTLMDGLKARSKTIFVIGATNRLDQLDFAVKRRLSNFIEFHNPSQEDISKYLSNFITLEDYSNVSEKIFQSSLSFSNIHELLKYSTKQRYLKNRHTNVWCDNDIIEYIHLFKI